MQKEYTLYIILQYFIDHSYKIGKRGYLCLKPTDFKKRYAIGRDLRTGKKERITTYNFSRRIFGKYRERLLAEKLIIRVNTTDGRSKYYSITPLGICRLIKSGLYGYDDKVGSKQQKKIFPILEAFAKRFVTPYRSEIFGKERIDFTNFYDNLINYVIDPHDIGEEMPYVFSEFNFYPTLPQHYEFSLELFFQSQTKIILTSFDDIGNPEIILSELGQKKSRFSNYNPIKLNEDQFHQYLSRLLLSLIVYCHFQIRHFGELSYRNDLPDFILQILFTFNRSVTKLINEQANIMENFQKIINQTQIKK